MSGDWRDDPERKAFSTACARASDSSRAVRQWFIAFGVGGVVLLLSSSDLLDALLQSRVPWLIPLLFIGGSSMQLLQEVISKYYWRMKAQAMATCLGQDEPLPGMSRAAILLAKAAFVGDLLTLAAFTIAVVLVARMLFAGVHQPPP